MKLSIRLFGKNFFLGDSLYYAKADYINYYTTVVKCANCKNTMLIYIKKGVHITDIITSVKCGNCEVRLEKEK